MPSYVSPRGFFPILSFYVVFSPLLAGCSQIVFPHLFFTIFLYHLSVLYSVISELIHSPPSLNFTPGILHSVFKLREWYASLSQSTPSSWMFVKQYENNSMICSELKSQYPLGIVKGTQQRLRVTWRKYPINLQDISCKAPVHSANDVSLCARMSKCHNK